jgi:hypothetical protein
VPERRPGHFVVDLDGAMIGEILLRRNALIRPAAVEKADLGYLFVPEVWGFGYAVRLSSCPAALGNAGPGAAG